MVKHQERYTHKKKRRSAKIFSNPLLSHLDSNQDKQNQNLSYYHYTMGHR